MASKPTRRHAEKAGSKRKAGSDESRSAKAKPPAKQSDVLVAASTPDRNADAQLVFDCARMQWQFGDWENLVRMDDRVLESHPDRATLALLVASAHQQLNNHAEARRLLSVAKAWGCDSKLIARLLVSGVYNTLGRAAALVHDEPRALGHFRQAVEGVSGDWRLACQARSVREVARLGLLDRAVEFIQGANVLVANQSEVAGYLPGRNAIVVAGMRHSGSTALFNAIKLALEQKQASFISFYSEGQNANCLGSSNGDLLLVKTHELRDDVVAHARSIITTRRDLRDTVASATRRNFPLLRKIGSAAEYAKYNRSLHDIWMPHSGCEFVYEAFMANPVAEVSRVLEHLGMEGVDVDAICRQLQHLPTDQYDSTLLSPHHITDPEHKESYRTTLASADVEKIERDHAAWLVRYGYKAASDRG